MYHTYRLKIGTVSALIVADDVSERNDEDIRRVFPTIPPEVLELVHRHPQWRGFSRNLLYLEGNGRRVLIDTGEGTLKPQKPGQGIAALEAAGVDLAAIDTIVITHMNGDHFGGLFDESNQMRFPNANLLISSEEWQYWMYSPNVSAEQAAFLRPIMTRLQPNTRLIDSNEWITPEIGAVSLHGHTPGHIGVLVSSEGDTMLHVVDALHMALQFPHPEVSPRFDVNPALAIATRRKALERAADEKLLLMGYHLPFPGLGYVTRDGEVFAWEPLS